MSGFSCASIFLGILTGQSQAAGSQLAVKASTLQAFRNGILIMTVSAVLLYTAVCAFSVLKLSQTDESEDGTAAGEYIEGGNSGT